MAPGEIYPRVGFIVTNLIRFNKRAVKFHWPIQPLATCSVWIAVEAATVENGCLCHIPGSHKANRLMAHEVKDDPNYTLNCELVKAEYDESLAEDLILPAGGMALHDVYIARGSEKIAPPIRVVA